jgi:ribosomal protein L7/L12
MAYCLHCGERLADGAVKCAACGSPVEVAEEEQSQPTSAVSIDPGLTDKVRQLARQGQKIQAIKEYRESTGASLKDAKEAVEAWMETEGISSSGAGCGTAALLLILLGIGSVAGRL